LGGLLVYDSATVTQVSEITNTVYAAPDGNEIRGYLAQPTGEGPFPAVIMLHEWWGLRSDVVELADRLAEEGYVVFAPDLYRGQVTTQVPRALYWRLTTPQEQISADTDAAARYVASLPTVDATRVASLGFCFGGQQSLLLGLRQPIELAATVMYYGSMVTDSAELAPLAESAPLLGIFGADDTSIPLSEVEAFETALEGLAIEHEITVYPGVGHAFVHPETIDAGGAAADAWSQTITFLADNLQP
jgi:carboxymethylenebutenolidase